MSWPLGPRCSMFISPVNFLLAQVQVLLGRELHGDARNREYFESRVRSRERVPRVAGNPAVYRLPQRPTTRRRGLGLSDSHEGARRGRRRRSRVASRFKRHHRKSRGRVAGVQSVERYGGTKAPSTAIPSQESRPILTIQQTPSITTSLLTYFRL